MRGRRVRKTVNGGSTGWMLDGDDDIAEFDTNGSLKLRYIPGPAIDQPIAMVMYGTNIHTYPQGSTISASDDTATKIEGPYLYDAYGNGAPTTGFPFKYTGRRLDAETGLYFYRARYYSPLLGRFLQTDPVGYGPDVNWYTYVGNDPTDKTDPTGRDSMCVEHGNCMGERAQPGDAKKVAIGLGGLAVLTTGTIAVGAAVATEATAVAREP